MSSLFLFPQLLTTIVCLGAARLATSNPIAYLPYAFGYSTADGMSREESGSGGRVSGSYSYTDANGDLRQVSGLGVFVNLTSPRPL